MSKVYLSKGIVLCSLLAAPCLARAALPTFELERLTLNPGAEHSLVLHTGDGLESGRLRLSLTGHYEHNPFVIGTKDEQIGEVIGYRVTTHLAAAYGVFDWLELGLQVPMILAQGGDDLPSEGLSTPSSVAMGAPSVQAHFTFARESAGAPLDLGLMTGVTLPLGETGALARDGGSGVSFSPRLGLGRTFGSMVRLGLEAGAIFREQETFTSAKAELEDSGSMAVLGVSASTVGKGLRGEVNVRGLRAFSDDLGSVEVLGGLRYPFAGRNFEAFALTGPGFGELPGTPLFRALAGVAWTPVKAESKSAPSEAVAVPRREQEAKPAEVVTEEAIPGAVAASSVEPERPEPQPAEKAQPVVKSEPAAVIAAEATQVVKVVIDEAILFGTDQWTVLPEWHAGLRRVATTIKQHPGMSVTVEGHTDARGGREMNLALSRARAESVRAFLVKEGVEPTRLRVVGHGPDRPAASNKTAAGLKKNRRVEFVADRDEK